MGFLTEAVERARRELERRPFDDGTLLLRTKVAPPPRDFEAVLRAPGISLIAEVKRASPWAGPIAEADPGQQAASYERGGASAISVLTEPRHFHGSLVDLRSARRATTLPVLRKDVLVHPSQVIEARAEGADAVLVITAVLTRSEVEEFRTVAEELGMAALVEVHGHDDLDRALEAGAKIVGINARDLESLHVDLEDALRLARGVPDDCVLVLDGGIRSRHQVRRAEEAGADAVLVGEALMRSAAPERTLRKLLGVLTVGDGGGR